MMLTFRWTIDIYAPKSTIPFIRNFLVASQELNDNHPLIKESEGQSLYRKYNLIGVTKGEQYKIINTNKQPMLIEIVECTHSVDCAGYKISALRKKLKAELKGKSRDELLALKKNGQELNEDVPLPLFVFLGDTTHKVFQDHPDILKFPVVIVECTFLLEEHLPNADKTLHMHWNNLKPIVEGNPNTFFVIIHFSARYSTSFINNFFKTTKGGATEDGKMLPNIYPWTDSTL